MTDLFEVAEGLEEVSKEPEGFGGRRSLGGGGERGCHRQIGAQGGHRLQAKILGQCFGIGELLSVPNRAGQETGLPRERENATGEPGGRQG